MYGCRPIQQQMQCGTTEAEMRIIVSIRLSALHVLVGVLNWAHVSDMTIYCRCRWFRCTSDYGQCLYGRRSREGHDRR